MAAVGSIGYISAVIATIRRDAHIFFTYRFRWLSQILSIFLSLTVFYYLSKLVKEDAVGAHGAYYAYAVIGILLVNILTSALTTARILRIELMQGSFENIVVSPLGPIWGIVSIIAFPLLYALLVALVSLAAATQVFGISLHMAGAAEAFGLTLLVMAAFAAIGLLFVAALVAFKSAAGNTWAVALFGLAGGAYFPTKLFPFWVRWISDVQPLSPTLDLIRHALLLTPTSESVGVEFAKVIGFTVVLVPLSIALLRLAVRTSRRRGTLLEF